MSRLASMTRYLLLDFSRHRLMLFIIIALPLLLLLMAVQSAPEQDTGMELAGEALVVDSESVSVVAMTMTAVVLVTSLTSFFAGFQLRTVMPRLRLMGYTSVHIQGGLVLLLAALDIYGTVVIGSVSLVWLDVEHLAGYYLTLFAGGAVFAVLGLVLARVVNTRALGLNIILMLAILDTAFLENPVFSRRFDEPWLDLMPGHRPVRLLYESVFLAEPGWLVGAAIIGAYIAAVTALLLTLGRVVHE